MGRYQATPATTATPAAATARADAVWQLRQQCAVIGRLQRGRSGCERDAIGGRVLRALCEDRRSMCQVDSAFSSILAS